MLIALGAAVVVAAALIAGSLLLTGGGDSSTTSTGGADSGLALLAGVPQSDTVLGSPAAKVTMLQYEDIQCPVCREYTEQVFPTIMREYVRPGKVKLDLRGLAFLGPDSEKGMRIVLAAGEQNKLWDVLELFYEQQGQENSGWVTDAKVNEILARVPGLDAAKVLADAKSARVTQKLQAAQDEARTRKVPGTPWFYIAIGSRKPYEIQPSSLTPDAFRPALDDALRG